MAARRPFLIRIDPAVLEALSRWADDDLRSINAQVEFLLRRALSDAGRLPKQESGAGGRKDKRKPKRPKEPPK